MCVCCRWLWVHDLWGDHPGGLQNNGHRLTHVRTMAAHPSVLPFIHQREQERLGEKSTEKQATADTNLHYSISKFLSDSSF